MTGTVKWFKQTYGFISSDEGQDFFVHQSDIQMQGHRTLEKGQRVSFDVAASLDKPGQVQAANVQVIE